MRKKLICVILAALTAASACTGCGISKAERSQNVVYVYNAGEYIDPDLLDQFTEETGIDVVYDEFESNEIMYPKIESGAAVYDVVCPSDYMIEKMIKKDLLQPLDYSKIPNVKNIGDYYIEQSRSFDPEHKYTIPYCWGTVGILYNKTMVSEKVDSWDILWNEKYKNEILMQDSVRDAFMVSLMDLGYSCNSVDHDEIEAATERLKAQKHLVQAYVVDQVRDKMIGNEAAIGVIYSGEALYTQSQNPNLEYVIPKEGTNLWLDCWVMPKNAKNVENGLKFLNFLCNAKVAAKNFEYITYSTPNENARQYVEDEELKNSTTAFPDLTQFHNLETYHYLGDTADKYLNGMWREVKSY